MRIIIAGGGTGGHLYPGIALAREFQRYDPKVGVIFIGTERGLESKVLPKEGFALKKIRVEGLMGKGVFRKFLSLMKLPIGMLDSIRILRDLQPDCVIGVGGYAAGPALMSASLMGFLTVILEQNAIPGITNRILSRFVNLVVTSFEDSRTYFKNRRVRVMGNPIRREIAEKEWKRKEKGIFTLLIFGGSQGASSINRAVIEALDYLSEVKDNIEIIHQTGEKDYDLVRRAYEERGFKAEVLPYIFDMSTAYSRADLILCRSGATTIAEVTANGKAAILVPYPYAAHDHQVKNAGVLERAGAAAVILDKDLKGERLAGIILTLFKDRERKKKMEEASKSLGRPDAAEKISELCRELIENRRKIKEQEITCTGR